METASSVSEDQRNLVKEIIKSSKKTSKNNKNEIQKALNLLHQGKSCSSCKASEFLDLSSKSFDKPRGENTLYIFVSTSLSPATLKALFEQAHQKGGTLIFKGLINNSFKTTKTFFEEHKINAEINPVLFEELSITHVPTFILKKEKIFDQIQGNISVEEALTQMKEKGDLKVLAQQILLKGKQL